MSIESSLATINPKDLDPQSAKQTNFRKALSCFLSLNAEDEKLMEITEFIFERLYQGSPDAVRIAGLIREVLDPFIKQLSQLIISLSSSEKAEILEKLLEIIHKEYGGQERLIAEYELVEFLESELKILNMT